MSSLYTRKSGGQGGAPRRRLSPAVIGALIAGVVVLAVVIAVGLSPRAPELPTRPAPQAMVPSPSAKRAAKAAADTDSKPIVEVRDDGKTLWASPTEGKPLALAYLPPGVQLIASIRTAAVQQHPEGDKIRDALGPLGQQALEWLEASLHVPLESIEQLVVGCQAMSDGGWETTLVLNAEPKVIEEALANLPAALESTHEGESFRVAGERAFYTPRGAGGKMLVVAPEKAMTDIIELAGEAPPLRRDIERLVAHTDADRHVTIIVAPNSLFSEGQSMFAGTIAGLRKPLFWFLGDELSAAALSLHWDENFFIELIATPTLDNSAERTARILTERLAKVPDELEAYVVGLDASAYGRLVVARFPGMIRKLAAYTRSGFDKDYATLRCYLPVVAGHNLLMATELTLAEQTGAGAPAAEAAAPAEAKDDGSVRERLKKNVSLKFARDTLEAALEQLGKDMGATIEIRGPDLQAEGITKNQSFGIDLTDRRAEEILVEILRLANPDKTATSATDIKQKLVYVIAPADASGAERIVVTTRTAAAARGDELPAAFKAD